MKLDLLKYMSDRYKATEEKKQKPAGPVITISRQYGCPAKKVAQKLVDILNLDNAPPPAWNWISKEILNEAAKELNVDPDRIKYVFDYEERNMADDILASMTHKYYKSDKKIRAVISKVIRSIAEEGHVVIVGRGGIAITRDIPASFHVNLEAPLEWRALRASSKHNISVEQAKKCAIDIDEKRQQFRDSFEGKDTDYTHFDLIFNCMTHSIDEIAETIAYAIKKRKLL